MFYSTDCARCSDHCKRNIFWFHENTQNLECALNVHLRHICACPKTPHICISLFGDGLKHNSDKFAWDHYQTMKCKCLEFWGMRKCAWGERLKHILGFAYFHEIRICYVYNGQSDTRNLCHKKCIAFIVHLNNNSAAARGLHRHCLQNGRESYTIRSRAWNYCCDRFCLLNGLESCCFDSSRSSHLISLCHQSDVMLMISLVL